MAKTHTEWLFYRRAFLNRPRHFGGAYVVAEVTRETYSWKDKKSGKPKTSTDLYASLVLADCNRTVNFSLETDAAARRRNTMHKLNLLIDILTQLRDTLEVEFAKK